MKIVLNHHQAFLLKSVLSQFLTNFENGARFCYCPVCELCKLKPRKFYTIRDKLSCKKKRTEFKKNYTFFLFEINFLIIFAK